MQLTDICSNHDILLVVKDQLEVKLLRLKIKFAFSFNTINIFIDQLLSE
jgi:hypothetical protein